MTVDEWVETTLNRLRGCADTVGYEGDIRAELAEAALELLDPGRGDKGYGPGFSAMVARAEPRAAQIVDLVRVNTPDLTGVGVVAIAADNIAAFASHEVEAERERADCEFSRGFDEFWERRPDGMDVIVYDTAAMAWEEATRAERERCAVAAARKPSEADSALADLKRAYLRRSAQVRAYREEMDANLDDAVDFGAD